jgi:hypothetical protein
MQLIGRVAMVSLVHFHITGTFLLHVCPSTPLFPVPPFQVFCGISSSYRSPRYHIPRHALNVLAPNADYRKQALLPGMQVLNTRSVMGVLSIQSESRGTLMLPLALPSSIKKSGHLAPRKYRVVQALDVVSSVQTSASTDTHTFWPV